MNDSKLLEKLNVSKEDLLRTVKTLDFILEEYHEFILLDGNDGYTIEVTINNVKRSLNKIYKYIEKIEDTLN